MTTTTAPADIVRSLADWPEDSERTDAVISESVKARRELETAMLASRAARAES